MAEHWTRQRGGLLSLSAATLAGALGGAGGAIVAPVPAPTVVASGALDVASYTRPEDGGDWARAIERAIASPECGPGCRIELGCGRKLEIASTIDVCRPVRLEGCAGLHDAARTKIVARTTTTAIAFRYRWWCEGRGLGGGAEGAELERVTLSEHRRPPSPIYRAGVLLEAQARLERVGVRGFGVGVLIDAGSKRGGGLGAEGSSNANSWRLDEVWIDSTDHAGVVARGPDSNAGLGLGVSVTHACSRAAAIERSIAEGLAWRWPAALPACAGISDDSFLGNTWIGPHVARPRDEAGVPRPAYLGGGDNQRSVWLGAYAEEDAALSVDARNGLALGGKSHWRPAGLRIGDRTIGPAVLVSPTVRSRPSPTLGVSTVLRLEAADGEWWTLDHDARATSPHLGWTRLLWRGASSGEVGAVRGGARR